MVVSLPPIDRIISVLFLSTGEIDDCLSLRLDQHRYLA
jgi:hypothetical protein